MCTLPILQGIESCGLSKWANPSMSPMKRSYILLYIIEMLQIKLRRKKKSKLYIFAKGAEQCISCHFVGVRKKRKEESLLFAQFWRGQKANVRQVIQTKNSYKKGCGDWSVEDKDENKTFLRIPFTIFLIFNICKNCIYSQDQSQLKSTSYNWKQSKVNASNYVKLVN